MTEFDAHQPNPLEQINIAQYSVPTFEALSDEQQASLREMGIDWVTQPVELRQFGSLEEFKQDSNNFFLSFGTGMVGPIYRDTAHYKRFETVHPDISTFLQAEIKGKSVDALSDSDWQNIMKAYAIVRHYVDAQDPYVVEDSKVDTIYLCR